MMDKLIIKTGDITRENVCAIVNAANASLMGGGGVDGAIHRAGGMQILEACRKIRKEQYQDGLPTGEAVATTAGNLQAKYVIHTLGPIYHQCGERCADLLASCYVNALKLAVELGCREIAFPAISTGIYGFPKEKAARIVYATVKDFLKKRDDIEVNFVFHNDKDKDIFEQTIVQTSFFN